MGRVSKVATTPRLLGALAVLAFYVALAILATLPLSSHPTDRLPDNADALSCAWSVAWVCHQLAHDPAGLFQANTFYPQDQALLFQDPMIGPALLGAPFYALTGDVTLTYNAVIVATLALSAFAVFLSASRLQDPTPCSTPTSRCTPSRVCPLVLSCS